MAHPIRSAPPPVDATGDRFLIVEGRFYEELNNQLVEGAKQAIATAGGSSVVITMRGALEIPAAIAIAFDKADAIGKPFAGAVALGVVIRGETTHYDIVANESSRALMDLSVARKLPLGNGIVTVENMAQAEARCRITEMNKGGDAAEAMLQLYALKKAASI
jgi:6,7-dimethyl-8-ribityllumazine synthase